MQRQLLVGIWRHLLAKPPPPSLIRSFSRLSRRPHVLPYTLPPSPILTQCRHLSLRSITSVFSTHPFPEKTESLSPYVVAHVRRLEADAAANPRDLQKQLAVFEALSEPKNSQGWDAILARWERMSESNPPSPILASDKAFEIYLQALACTSSEPETAVESAVQGRESLLAQYSLTANSSTPDVHTSLAPATSEGQTNLASTPPSEPTPTPTPAPAPAPVISPHPSSRSQTIAKAVLSRIRDGSAQAQNSGAGSTADTNKDTRGTGLSSDPIHVVVSEPKGAWLPKLGRFVAYLFIGGAILLTVLAFFLENSGLVKAAPRQNEFEPHETSKPVKFSDVHGVDEAKEELKDVVAFLKDPSSFSALGGKLPKGVLLTGEPGTGKTMLARAVAGEAGVPFLFASGSEFDEMFVGVGAKRVRELFAAARKKQPAIIFIDELDAVGGKRNARDQQYMKQTLNQLLVEMDGFLQSEGVIVIAATNFPESLDEALVRPGRFDRHIAVPLPDIRGRAQIIMHHMKDIVTGRDVDPTILARGTSGFSGADLQNMVNQAAIQASKERAKEVTLKHMEWARDRILMGAERRSMVVDDEVKKLTAYHEGGHALVALYTEGAMPLHKVTCMPRGHALGITSQLPKDDRISISRKEFLASIDVSMGGRVAEELIYGPENVTSGASSDIQSATATATRMVKNWGYSEKIGPVYLNDRVETISARKREEIENEVRRFVQAGEARASALLRSRIDELHRLAKALIEHETLTMEEVKRVVRGEPIRDITDVISEDLTKMKTPDSTATVDAPAPAAAASSSTSSDLS